MGGKLLAQRCFCGRAQHIGQIDDATRQWRQIKRGEGRQCRKQQGGDDGPNHGHHSSWLAAVLP
jgi:hypothetical protein